MVNHTYKSSGIHTSGNVYNIPPDEKVNIFDCPEETASQDDGNLIL